MALADVLSGLAGASHEYHTNLLKMDYEKKANLAQMYGKISEDESYPEEMRAEALKRAITIHTLEPGKKLPKEFESMQFTVAPGKESKTVSQPSVPMASGPPLPSPDIQEPLPAHPTPFAPMPFDERMRRATQESIAKSAGASGIAAMKAAIPSKIGRDVIQVGGERYPLYTYQRRNPQSGEMEQYTIKGDYALGKFAPRAATPVRAIELQAAVEDGYPAPRNEDNTPLDLYSLLENNPNAVVQPIGENRYRLVSEPQRTAQAGGVLYPFGQYSGINKTQPIGPSRTGMATQGPIATGPSRITGQPTFGTQTTIRTPLTPGAYGAPQRIEPPAPPTREQLLGPRAQFGSPDLINNIGQALSKVQGPVNVALTPPEAAIAPYPGQIPQPAPEPFQAPPPAAPPTPQPRAGVSVPPEAINPAILNREAQMMLSIRPAMRMLVGTQQNPFFEPLEAFGHLADDPKARERIGTAFRGILENLSKIEKRGGGDAALKILGTGVPTFGITDVIKNFLGMPGLIARAEVTSMEQLIKPLSDEEKRMVARMMAAYGTVVGFRKFTGAGAYQFSTDAMSREIPVPGMTGINSSKSFFNKLAQLIEEPAAAIQNLYSIDPSEKAFYEKSALRLSIRGRASEVRQNRQTGQRVYLVDNRWYDGEGNPL